MPGFSESETVVGAVWNKNSTFKSTKHAKIHCANNQARVCIIICLQYNQYWAYGFAFSIGTIIELLYLHVILAPREALQNIIGAGAADESFFLFQKKSTKLVDPVRSSVARVVHATVHWTRGVGYCFVLRKWRTTTVRVRRFRADFVEKLLDHNFKRFAANRRRALASTSFNFLFGFRH